MEAVVEEGEHGWTSQLRFVPCGSLRKVKLTEFTVNEQPKSGDHPMDLTAVESTQITWAMLDRRFWPRVLTLWDRPTPRNNPTYHVGTMRYKGHPVLDYAGNPIRNFRFPVTVSSNVEGLRLEAWLRSDNRLTMADIVARMWTKDAPEGGKTPAMRNDALAKRASLQRKQSGLISWVRKRGNEAQHAAMDRLRTPAQRAENLATDIDPAPEPRRSRTKKRKGKPRGAAAGPSPATATAGPSDTVGADSGHDDSSTNDRDGDEAVQETHQASRSSSLEDPLDSRNDQPTNPEEQALLRQALENTVEEFRELTTEEPELTNPGENYFSQWAMLQYQFRFFWEANGNTVEAPRLVARNRWTGGIARYYLGEEIEGVPDVEESGNKDEGEEEDEDEEENEEENEEEEENEKNEEEEEKEEEEEEEEEEDEDEYEEYADYFE